MAGGKKDPAMWHLCAPCWADGLRSMNDTSSRSDPTEPPAAAPTEPEPKFRRGTRRR